MGLQHAIHDVRDDTHEGAGEKSRATRRNGVAGLSQTLAGFMRCVPTLLRGSRGGRTSIWRVLTLAIIVYVAALNLANFLVVRPVRSRLDDLVEKKAVIEDFLLLRQSGQAVAGVRDALMRGDERVTVLGDVRNMAADAGLRMVGEPHLLSPRDASKRMTEYPMEITLEGSYHEVGEFLCRLESSSRILTVHEVEIDASDKSASRAEITVTVGALTWEE